MRQALQADLDQHHPEDLRVGSCVLLLPSFVTTARLPGDFRLSALYAGSSPKNSLPLWAWKAFGVEGAFDHADAEVGVFEDGRPVPVASKPLHRSAFVSAQGGPFGHTTGKDNLGVSRPGFLPWMRNSF